MKKILYSIFISIGCFTSLAAQERPILDIELTNYTYPFPVAYYHFKNQQQDLKMVYMDVQPKDWNGKTIVLLHGKNFNGAYWKQTITDLSQIGYRVIAPDQIGFGKSTKPLHYQFTLQQLAQNTAGLLEELNVKETILLGHSMGGMLGTRFALMYPEKVQQLILENPIGLEDWKLKAPYTSIDQHYQQELKVSYETTKNYQLENYYDQTWKPEYDEWVYLLTGWTKDQNYPIVAYNNAQTSDMIFTQPVYYEFQYLQVPTLFIIGTRDKTAIGKQHVSSEVRETMGNYNVLGKSVIEQIPNGKLIELEDVGHLPHIEVYPQFIAHVKAYLQ